MTGRLLHLAPVRRRLEAQDELRRLRLAYVLQVGPDAVSLLLGTEANGTEICTTPEGAEWLAAELMNAAKRAREVGR